MQRGSRSSASAWAGSPAHRRLAGRGAARRPAGTAARPARGLGRGAGRGRGADRPRGRRPARPPRRPPGAATGHPLPRFAGGVRAALLGLLVAWEQAPAPSWTATGLLLAAGAAALLARTRSALSPVLPEAVPLAGGAAGLTGAAATGSLDALGAAGPGVAAGLGLALLTVAVLAAGFPVALAASLGGGAVLAVGGAGLLLTPTGSPTSPRLRSPPGRRPCWRPSGSPACAARRWDGPGGPGRRGPARDRRRGARPAGRRPPAGPGRGGRVRRRVAAREAAGGPGRGRRRRAARAARCRHHGVGRGWARVAVDLAVVGAAAGAYALVVGSRAVAAGAVGALVAARWSAVGSAGIEVVEAYTLPAAVGLLVFAVPALRAGGPSWAAEGTAVAVALLPSALWRSRSPPPPGRSAWSSPPAWQPRRRLRPPAGAVRAGGAQPGLGRPGAARPLCAAVPPLDHPGHRRSCYGGLGATYEQRRQKVREAVAWVSQMGAERPACLRGCRPKARRACRTSPPVSGRRRSWCWRSARCCWPPARSRSGRARPGRVPCCWAAPSPPERCRPGCRRMACPGPARRWPRPPWSSPRPGIDDGGPLLAGSAVGPALLALALAGVARLQPGPLTWPLGCWTVGQFAAVRPVSTSPRARRAPARCSPSR